jgi:hypothetical protein
MTRLLLVFTLLALIAGPAGAGEHWKIVATIHNGKNLGETMRLVYGTRETGAIYFDSEAACKAELADPKGQFNVMVWKRIKELVKKNGDTAEPPACVMDLVAPKDTI